MKEKPSREEKRAAFLDAVERLGIRPADAVEVFGISRQTYYSWFSGKARIPETAFYWLAVEENKRFLALHEREIELRKLAAAISPSGLNPVKG
jgi:hypothetical protein